MRPTTTDSWGPGEGCVHSALGGEHGDKGQAAASTAAPWHGRRCHVQLGQPRHSLPAAPLGDSALPIPLYGRVAGSTEVRDPAQVTQAVGAPFHVAWTRSTPGSTGDWPRVAGVTVVPAISAGAQGPAEKQRPRAPSAPQRVPLPHSAAEETGSDRRRTGLGSAPTEQGRAVRSGSLNGVRRGSGARRVRARGRALACAAPHLATGRDKARLHRRSRTFREGE